MTSYLLFNPHLSRPSIRINGGRFLLKHSSNRIQINKTVGPRWKYWKVRNSGLLSERTRGVFCLLFQNYPSFSYSSPSLFTGNLMWSVILSSPLLSHNAHWLQIQTLCKKFIHFSFSLLIFINCFVGRPSSFSVIHQVCILVLQFLDFFIVFVCGLM